MATFTALLASLKSTMDAGRFSRGIAISKIRFAVKIIASSRREDGAEGVRGEVVSSSGGTPRIGSRTRPMPEATLYRPTAATTGVTTCGCEDHARTGKPCKHIVALVATMAAREANHAALLAAWDREIAA